MFGMSGEVITRSLNAIRGLTSPVADDALVTASTGR